MTNYQKTQELFNREPNKAPGISLSPITLPCKSVGGPSKSNLLDFLEENEVTSKTDPVIGLWKKDLN